MDFIRDSWALWLILMLVSLVLTLIVFFRLRNSLLSDMVDTGLNLMTKFNERPILGGSKSGHQGRKKSSFFSGKAAALVLLNAFSSVMGIMLLLSLILNIITYAKS